MKFKDNYLICNEQGFFLNCQATKRPIPKEYATIINAIANGGANEDDIIKELVRTGMSETEAALLCAEFILAYSDELEAEPDEDKS